MQRYFAQDKKENKLILKDTDLHHIKNVMRNKIGDTIECIYQENLFLCKIETLDNNEVLIITEKSENHELDIDVTIAISLVKEQKWDLILQKITELGINKIIPLIMERSIIKLEQNKIEKKYQRWATICKEASEQSKRNKIPTISSPMTIDELIKEEYDIRYICSTTEQNNTIAKALPKELINKKILFVLGPEGGISPKEEEKMKKSGMISISLGTRIMRVETAAIYVSSIINYCSMR